MIGSLGRSPGATSRRDAQRGNNDWIRGQVLNRSGSTSRAPDQSES
jgi:hypothetical protein